jgi:hypothetical protein
MSKKKNETPKQRNWIAVAAHFKTGSGSHTSKKSYTRKRKHKGRTED